MLESASRAALGGMEDGGEERALRLSWIAVGHDIEAPTSWRLDASVRPIPPNTLSRRAGSRAVTAPERFRRDSPGFKSTSYFGAVAALRHARRSAGTRVSSRTGTCTWRGPRPASSRGTGGRLAGLGPGGLPSVTAEAFLDGAGERRGLDAGGAALRGDPSRIADDRRPAPFPGRGRMRPAAGDAPGL